MRNGTNIAERVEFFIESKQWGGNNMWGNMDIQQSNDKFSTATLLYARLRRVTSRVIDVMYLTENNDYAHYVIELALATNDSELQRLALKLDHLLPTQSFEMNKEIIKTQSAPQHLNSVQSSEPTQEDIYQHQVSHRYIGSLR